MKNKKLTAADEKFIKEFLDGDNLDFSADAVFIRKNRFSGISVELCTISAAAYDFVTKVEPNVYNSVGLQRIHSKLTTRNVISKFDRARYIVGKLQPEAFMRLID